MDFELLSFKATVVKQMCYNRKKDYFILIDEYLSRIITPYEFRSKKQNIIDWRIFDIVTLSCFDSYYSRENNKQDKISSADFIENCYKKIKQTNKNIT